jgi:hypothetical protein
MNELLARPLTDAEFARELAEELEYERTVGCPGNKGKLISTILELRKQLGLSVQPTENDDRRRT